MCSSFLQNRDWRAGHPTDLSPSRLPAAGQALRFQRDRRNSRPALALLDIGGLFFMTLCLCGSRIRKHICESRSVLLRRPGALFQDSHFFYFNNRIDLSTVLYPQPAINAGPAAINPTLFIKPIQAAGILPSMPAAITQILISYIMLLRCRHVAATESCVARCVRWRLCSGSNAHARVVRRSRPGTGYPITAGDAGRAEALACTGRH